MPVFPIFVDLKNRKCIIVGGGDVASRKAETLLEFGASVTVISKDLNDGIAGLRSRYEFELKIKEYEEKDIVGAFLVIAATSDKEINEKVSNDALKNKLLVNIVDCPEKCSFIFPSVIKRNDLVVGISTSGTYPAMSKALRKRIGEMLPEVYGDILEILKEYRRKALKAIPDRTARRIFLYKILDEALLYNDRRFLNGRQSLEGKLFLNNLRTRINDLFKEYGNE